MQLQNFYLDLKLGPHVKEIMAVYIYIYYEYCLYIYMECYCHIPTHELLSTRWMTILWKTTKHYWIEKNPLQTKRKNHIRIRSIDVLLWRHLHFIFKQFSRRKLTHQLLGVLLQLTNYNSLFHSWIRNICYQVHWGNFLLTW